MIARTQARWLTSVVLATLALVAINLLVTTSPVEGRPAASLINCSGSIQACIDAANDGDTILIAAGTYTESLTLSKPVSLTGESRDTTIIHAMAGQRVLTVTGATISNSVVISGLTFTGGDVTSGSSVCPQNCGGGIWIDDAAQPVLDSIIVINNAADRIGGIRARVLILKDSLISNNIGGGADAFTATINGGQFTGNTNFGGLVVESLTLNGTAFISNSNLFGVESGGVTVYQTAIISGAQFEDNIGGDGLGGGALQARNAPLIITNTLFRHNDNSAIYVDNSDTILSHCRFEDNYNATYGAGIWAFGHVTATDTVFISNTAKDGGAGLTAINANISGGSFQNNRSTEIYGGGLYVLGEATITGTDFISNSAESGGGAYLSTAVITNAYFSQNIATSYVGGGLSAGDLSLSQGTFVNNSAAERGGGAFVYGTTSITDSMFISNTAQSGGGLYTDAPLLTLIDSDFGANTGGGVAAGASRIIGGHFSNNLQQPGLRVDDALDVSGTQFISNELGGIYATHGPATVVNARFEGNSGGWTGGGMYFDGASSGGASSLVLSNTEFIRNYPGVEANAAQVTTFKSRFESNYSAGGGAALWVDGSYPYPPVMMIDTEVISNVSTGGSLGGAVFSWGAVHLLGGRFENNRSAVAFGSLYSPQVYLTDTQFISNSSPVGGGIFGDATIYGGRFERNSSTDVGGALAGGDFYLSGTVVISNTTDGYGGGVSATGATTLINVRMENNQATTGGGIQTNLLIVTDSQILSNTAAIGGGAVVYEGGRVVNAVLAGNRAISNGATIALDAPGRLDLLHTTIADTILNPQPAISVLNGALHITNTIIASHTIAISNTAGIVYEDYNLFFNTITNTIGVTNGGHSLVGDPKFVDPFNGDYHLQFGSAAIDHGVDAGVYTDLDGNPRPIGAGFDIGAYEYQGGHYLWLPLIRK